MINPPFMKNWQAKPGLSTLAQLMSDPYHIIKYH